jgi:hypothetical protein
MTRGHTQANFITLFPSHKLEDLSIWILIDQVKFA